MKIADRVKTLRFSDVKQRAQKLQADLDKAEQNDFIVDWFDGGKSPGVAGYKALKRMESLEARVGDGNPTIEELEKDLDKTVERRSLSIGLPSIAVGLSLVGAMAAVVLHRTGAIDLGTAGDVLFSNARFLGAGATALPLVNKKLSNLLTKPVRADKRFLDRMEYMFERDYRKSEATDPAQWSPEVKTSNG